MNMPCIQHTAIVVAVLSVVAGSRLYAQDAKGCTDHPLITRYPGAVLAWCEEQNHVEYAIARGPVTGNAEWMKLQIEQYGKVAINDILFDTDKATIQAASSPVVAEVAKLLGMMPELKVYVVGHTDMSGTLEHNLDLSKRRAAEVVRVLATDHGIAAAQLDAHGVGPLAPVSTNKTEAGRQLNRRVELVAR